MPISALPLAIADVLAIFGYESAHWDFDKMLVEDALATISPEVYSSPKIELRTLI